MDITKLGKAQVEPFLSEQEWELVFDSIPDLIAVIDRNYTIRRVNRPVAERLGISKDQAVGMHCFEVFHGACVPIADCPHARLLEDGNEHASEIEEPVLGGPFHITVSPIRDAEGRPVGSVHVARDVTQRNEMARSLVKTVAYLGRANADKESLLESARAILEHRDFGECSRRIFDAAKKTTGAAAGYVALLTADGNENEVLFVDSGGLPCTVDPSLPMPIRGLRGEAYATGKTVYDNDFRGGKWMEFMPDGHADLENVMFAPLVIEGKTVGLLGLANKPGGFDQRDVQMVSAFGEFAAIALLNSRAEDMLRQSEKKYRAIFNNASVGIDVLDSQSRFAEVNSALANMLGYAPEELRELTNLDLTFPDDREASEKKLAALMTGEISSYRLEKRYVRKDGGIVWGDLSVSSLRDAKGQPRMTIGVIADITERKRYEDRQKELLEEIKQFAYIVSHDLRAPLVNIKGFCGELRTALDSIRPLLQKARDSLSTDERRKAEFNLDEDIPESLGFIESSVSRMDRLIDSVLRLSRLGRSELNFETLDMNSVVRDVVEGLSHEIRRKGISVSVGELPDTFADRTAMQQIIGNLLDNAIKYAHPDRPGTIKIVGWPECDENVFQVHDNGIGIRKEDRERIFQVFQRAGDQAVAGEGMGLAHVRTLVRRHHGRVWRQPGPGSGSTFTFTISKHLAYESGHKGFFPGLSPSSGE